MSHYVGKISVLFRPNGPHRCAYGLILLALYGWPRAVVAADWHVTPEGTADGDGSDAAAWDLSTAFAHPRSVQPGDTIWLHEGTYAIDGPLYGRIEGTAEAPILVRAVPGKRVTLDTGDYYDNRISIFGAYTWYWGFELTSSAQDRYADDGSDSSLDRGRSIDAGLNSDEDHPGIKLINLVAHDTAAAIGFWRPLTEESEVYGCLLYFNGREAPWGGTGHAIYTQNLEGPKYIRDNIMFGQYNYGIHAYTQDLELDALDNFVMEGNISFENGISSSSGRSANLLIGGWQPAKSPQLRNNYMWYDRGHTDGISCDLGFSSATVDGIIENNVCVGGGVSFRVDGVPTSILGNTFVGPIDGFDAGMWPDNDVYEDTVPAGAMSFVRPNAYDSDRAHVVIFNWDLADTVEVDLSALLNDGDGFELLDAQNYFGDPVLTGTYDGPVAIPMALDAVSAVVGTPATPWVHTSAEFGAFVLVRTEAGPGGSDDGTGGDGTTGGGGTGVSGATGASASASAGGSEAADTTLTGAGSQSSGNDSATEDGGLNDDGAGGCGCRASSSSHAWWLAALPFARRRRRG